jgi:hypothetical protein
MPTAETIRVARRVREAFAPSGLTPLQAKLYSQRIRREMGREGLPTFEAGAVFTYLEDAIFLLDCALIEREGDPGGSWRMGVKRAAEILEWLSQPSLRPERSPLHLLSAAAFQVAAYPAMALGELQRVPNDDSESKILLQFLRADFPATLALIHDFGVCISRRREQHFLPQASSLLKSCGTRSWPLARYVVTSKPEKVSLSIDHLRRSLI